MENLLNAIEKFIDVKVRQGRMSTAETCRLDKRKELQIAKSNLETELQVLNQRLYIPQTK
jgi:hypothetical protein